LLHSRASDAPWEQIDVWDGVPLAPITDVCCGLDDLHAPTRQGPKMRADARRQSHIRDAHFRSTPVPPAQCLQLRRSAATLDAQRRESQPALLQLLKRGRVDHPAGASAPL
jgi:hypothetical protein